MSSKKILRKQWAELAPHWVKMSREEDNPVRTVLLDKPMLEECGDISGKVILDVGCGEGRFCRILSERGASRVIGIDACDSMIEACRELQSDTTEFYVADAEKLEGFEEESFDLVVSYLNMCDLKNFKANLKKINRLLKVGGRYIIANLHPMRSATGLWCRNEDGSKRHVNLDNYFDETERSLSMKDIEFTNFHRSLSTYFNSFIEAGFNVEKIVEPTISSENVKRYPGMADELRVPNFIIFNLKRI